jgi:hypothetical protein
MGEHRKVAANKKVAFHMRVRILNAAKNARRRSAGVALLVFVAAVLCTLTSTMTAVFTLAASTYIVKGTQFGFPFCAPSCGVNATDPQNIALATPYITGTVGPPPGTVTVVPYPASFWPISTGYIFDPTYNHAVEEGVAALPPPNGPNGIQPGSVIFGYSQGANVATVYKRNFNAAWASNPSGAPSISFVLIGNGNRPNGGALERFNGLYIPILNFSFNGATPTNTAGAAPGQITTYDIARQYDGFADFPTNPLNLLADANAVAGIILVHPGYGSVNMSQAVFQGTYGDTAYYMIPTYPLPLLMPLQMVPVVGPILADTLDPALRVLVEAGYNRTINPGVPTPANFLYFPNPVALGTSFLVAIPTGLDNGVQDILGIRVFGTTRPDALHGFVVGGPPLTLPGQTPPPIPSMTLAQTVATPAPSPQAPANVSNATASTPQPPPDTIPVNTPSPAPAATGPRLNVFRPSLGGSPRLQGTNSAASSVNGVPTTVTSTVNGVASAINGAVTKSVTAIAGALGANPAGAAGTNNTSSTG